MYRESILTLERASAPRNGEELPDKQQGMLPMAR
jgi:hypothetical protein